MKIIDMNAVIDIRSPMSLEIDKFREKLFYFN